MLTANIRNLQMCKVLLYRPPVDPTKSKFGFFPFVSESQHPRHDWGGGGSEAPSRDGRPHLRGEEAPPGRGAGRCGERYQVGTGSNLVQEFRLCDLSCSMMGGIPQRLTSERDASFKMTTHQKCCFGSVVFVMSLSIKRPRSYKGEQRPSTFKGGLRLEVLERKLLLKVWRYSKPTVLVSF